MAANRMGQNDGTISAVSGSKVMESRSTFRGHIVGCTSILVLTFRPGDMQCRVQKSRKSGKNWCFLHPEFGGQWPQNVCGAY